MRAWQSLSINHAFWSTNMVPRDIPEEGRVCERNGYIDMHSLGYFSLTSVISRGK